MRIGILTSNFPSSSTELSTAGAFVRDIAIALQNEFDNVVVLSPKHYLSDDLCHFSIGGLASSNLRSLESKFGKKYFQLGSSFLGIMLNSGPKFAKSPMRLIEPSGSQV
jgi:hypothetical protein